MSSRPSLENIYKKQRLSIEPRRGCGQHRTPHESGHTFGLDAKQISPRVQIIAALAVLAPVALSGIALVALVPGLWWVFTTYFWIAFPALGLMAKGILGLFEEKSEAPLLVASRERELLKALEKHGELTPARAAMETSLSVAEADEMLKKLAEAGHLEVLVRGGGLFYTLWGRVA